MNTNKPTVISTFAGCGGSSLGYKWAGFKELLAIDFDKNAHETFKLNFPEVKAWHRDICTVSADEIFNACDIKKGDLDVFDGSPPCQGFSTTGKRIISDDRNNLFLEYLRLINDLNPKVFLMENVTGQIKGNFKGFFKEIINQLRATGYQVKCMLMNSMWYGVPQSRERLIYIGTREDMPEPSFPQPTTTKPITVRQALDGLPPQKEDRPMKSWLKQACTEIKQSHNNEDVKRIFLKYKGTTSSAFSTSRIKFDKPCYTILKSEIACSGFIHPVEHRYLTIDELKRLSSFPDDFKFIDRSSAVNRIGNAVMPKFMQAIAEHIKNNILRV